MGDREVHTSTCPSCGRNYEWFLHDPGGCDPCRFEESIKRK